MAQIPDLLKVSLHADDFPLFQIALKATNCRIVTITKPDLHHRQDITVDSEDIMNIYELGRVFATYISDRKNSKSRKNINKP